MYDGISTSVIEFPQTPRDRIKAKRKFDLDFIKLNGDLSFFNAYSLPTTIVFDKRGNEAFRLTGGVDFNTKNFIDRIYNIEKL